MGSKWISSLCTTSSPLSPSSSSAFLGVCAPNTVAPVFAHLKSLSTVKRLALKRFAEKYSNLTICRSLVHKGILYEAEDLFSIRLRGLTHLLTQKQSLQCLWKPDLQMTILRYCWIQVRWFCLLSNKTGKSNAFLIL